VEKYSAVISGKLSGVSYVYRGVTTTGAPGAGAPPAFLLKFFLKKCDHVIVRLWQVINQQSASFSLSQVRLGLITLEL